MRHALFAVLLLWLTCFPVGRALSQVADAFAQPKPDVELRLRIEASPLLPFLGVPLRARPVGAGWKSGAVSGIAVGPGGTIYELLRGDGADPVLVLNPDGEVLQSWGKGNYTIPHTIRLDRAGNVWTVDAGTSTVVEYSPGGKKLLKFSIGLPAKREGAFNGATDIAFGPRNRLYVTDGYGNARVVLYTRTGRKVAEWGHAGAGPGSFHLPHAIQIDERDHVYIADRENGRIEEFTPAGKYLRQIPHLGRIYSLRLVGKVIWASMGSFNQPPGSGGGWIVKLDRDTGAILGHLDVPEERAGHSLDVTSAGEPMITEGDEVLWFKHR